MTDFELRPTSRRERGLGSRAGLDVGAPFEVGEGEGLAAVGCGEGLEEDGGLGGGGEGEGELRREGGGGGSERLGLFGRGVEKLRCACVSEREWSAS